MNSITHLSGKQTPPPTGAPTGLDPTSDAAALMASPGNAGGDQAAPRANHAEDVDIAVIDSQPRAVPDLPGHGVGSDIE